MWTLLSQTRRKSVSLTVLRLCGTSSLGKVLVHFKTHSDHLMIYFEAFPVVFYDHAVFRQHFKNLRRFVGHERQEFIRHLHQSCGRDCWRGATSPPLPPPHFLEVTVYTPYRLWPIHRIL